MAAAVPLLALVAARLRVARARQAIGLASDRTRDAIAPVVAIVAIAVLVGVAAAQPIWRSEDSAVVRTDAAAYIVVDTSRSMLAAKGPGAKTRLERSVRAALRLRDALGDVPTGLASVSDRALPHLFPTPDREAFASVLTRTLRAGHPEPVTHGLTGSDLSALAALPTDNFFDPAATHRIVVVLTDAESVPPDDDVLQRAFLASPRPTVVVVRIGSAGERVYAADGRMEPEYAPVAGADRLGRQLATVTAGTVFTEANVESAVRAVAAARGSSGPTGTVARGETDHNLAPWLLVAAAIPLAFLLCLRNFDLSGRRTPARSLATLRPARRRSSVG